MDRQPFFAGKNSSLRLDELDARLVRRDEVLRLLNAGQKINAIKVYRQDTGASLADAKAAVERMELAFSMGMAAVAQEIQEEALSGSVAMGVGEMEMLAGEIARMVAHGQKIHAIKLYRERTGTDLRTAKEAVDALGSGLMAEGSALFQSQMVSQVAGEPGEEVRRLALAGDKIRAIKLYRQQTGLSLADAKAAIDRLR